MDRTLKPVASVALSAKIKRNSIEEIRVGIGCAFSTPLEKHLNDKIRFSTENLKEHVTELAKLFAEKLPDPLDNVFASASYRRRMIAILLARQLLNIATAKS
jgi:CO/xanthine dehydrogenase FAD-binding subunit